MNNEPLVSVIVIFFNAERFLGEAIDSVLKQTYENWELLLVDDGSRDASRAIAERYAGEHVEQVQVLEHAGNVNRGKNFARNLGIQCATGKYIAFLDADDVWLGEKLEEQVAILESHRDAGMLYGETLYWHSWTGNARDRKRDFIPALNVPLDKSIEPPHLLPLYLHSAAAVPCICSILVKRSVVEELGGFDETCSAIANIYEDQAFYAKIVLNSAVVASSRCWDLYRQHPQSSMSYARGSGQEIVARHAFLRWLEQYLARERVQDATVWRALRREQWLLPRPILSRLLRTSGRLRQRLKLVITKG